MESCAAQGRHIEVRANRSTRLFMANRLGAMPVAGSAAASKHRCSGKCTKPKP
jgi:hypothetical protein